MNNRVDKERAGLLTIFDRLRCKRNTVLYDDIVFVSKHDAEEALAAAHEYLEVIRTEIERRQPDSRGGKP